MSISRDFDRYIINDSSILRKILQDCSRLPDYHPIGNALLRLFSKNASEMMLLKCCVVNEMEILKKREDPFRVDSLRSYILAEYLTKELDPLIMTLFKMLTKMDRKTKTTPPRGKKDATSPRSSHRDDATELALAVEIINYLKGEDVQFSNNVILIMTFIYEVAKEEDTVDPFNVLNAILFLRTICPGIIRRAMELSDNTIRRSIVGTVKTMQLIVNGNGILFNFYHQKILSPRDDAYCKDIALLYNAYCQTTTLVTSHSDTIGRREDEELVGTRLPISPSAPL